jgi:Cytochrome c, mono- and diheme variants
LRTRLQRTRSWFAGRVSAITLFGLLVSGCALADEGTDTYKKRCAACHGATGAGDTMIGKNQKIRSLRSPDVQKQSDDELFNVISKGRYKMPAYDRKLSREQIRELVHHIRSWNR